MMKINRAGLLAALVAASFAATAADFDGSKPLVCATIEAHDCDVGETCIRGLPESVGAPQFLRIDFAKKVMVGTKQSTPIRTMESGPEQVLLQGIELGFAWTLALDSASGKLSGSMVNKDGAFVVFGACTPQ